MLGVAICARVYTSQWTADYSLSLSRSVGYRAVRNFPFSQLFLTGGTYRLAKALLGANITGCYRPQDVVGEHQSSANSRQSPLYFYDRRVCRPLHCVETLDSVSYTNYTSV